MSNVPSQNPQPKPFPDPVLMVGDLMLRPISRDDAASVADASTDTEIPRFTHTPGNMNVERATAWIERAIANQQQGSGIRWAILNGASGEFLGQCGMHVHGLPPGIAETYYWIVASARRRGVAWKSLRAITEWGFEEQKYRRMQLLVDPDNLGSQGVAAKAGYRREGLLRGYREFADDGKTQRDLLIYGLVASDLRL